jgi:hypothetical protein
VIYAISVLYGQGHRLAVKMPPRVLCTTPGQAYKTRPARGSVLGRICGQDMHAVWRRRVRCVDAGQPVVSGAEVELDRVGAVGSGRAADHWLEGALQVQSRQGAGALVAYDLAAAGLAGAGAGQREPSQPC